MSDWETKFNKYLFHLLKTQCNLSDDVLQLILEKYIHYFIYAFTDSSFNATFNENYEDFEFHGDGIVNATTKDFIFKKFRTKTDKVGNLSELENNLRSKPVLAAYSINLGMPAYARVDFDKYVQNKKKIKNKATLAEDIFESFVGALAFVIDLIYPEKYGYGHTVASLFVLKQLESQSLNNLQLGHEKTAKKRTILKELFQKAHFGEINFVIVAKPAKNLDNTQPYTITIELPDDLYQILNHLFPKANYYQKKYFGLATNYILDLAKEAISADILIYLKSSFGINTDFMNKNKQLLYVDNVDNSETEKWKKLLNLITTQVFLPNPIDFKYISQLPTPSQATSASASSSLASSSSSSLASSSSTSNLDNNKPVLSTTLNKNCLLYKQAHEYMEKIFDVSAKNVYF